LHQPVDDTYAVYRIGQLKELEEGLGVQQFDKLLGVQAGLGGLFQPIRLSLGENSPELIFAHGHQRPAGPHQVGSVKVIGGATRSGRNVKH
jgi:hypothetical protein